jgi:hypothetical protein
MYYSDWFGNGHMGIGELRKEELLTGARMFARRDSGNR